MSISRRFVAALVSVMQLVMSSVVMLPSNALAQVPDGEPPTIQFERIAEGVRGDRQVFSATVTDEVGLDVVTLHYRLGDSDSYDTLTMEPLIGTDIFTASVDTVGTRESVLQYYIEARDVAGNRSIQGFAFDPIERALVDRASTLAEAPVAEPRAEPPAASGISTGRKVLYGVLGVLAVGALAAAAGGGGGGGSDRPSADDPQIPLDIVVDQL